MGRRRVRSVIGRRQVLAAALVLPIACSPSSSKACSIDLPLSTKGARAVIEKLSQVWWSRDRASFLAQFMEDLEAQERQQVEALSGNTLQTRQRAKTWQHPSSTQLLHIRSL